MSEVTKKEGMQVLPEGAIGKTESDPTNPEIKTATINLEIIQASDGYLFIDRQNALDHEEALRDRSKTP